MSETPKKYFHDRIILLVLTINGFLTLLCAILVLLRLDDRVNGYIVEFRASRGINRFKTGDTSDIAAFVVFALVILLLNTLLSRRAYGLHRQFGIGILCLGTLLIVLSLIASNALLVLR